MLRRPSLSDAISSIFTGSDDKQPIIGKNISRPTKSFATRTWASAAADNHPMDYKNDPNEDNLHIELKHAHMQLLAERARVQDLEKNLKALTAEKYSSQSSIIQQLTSSQDALRTQLQLVINSKMQLCESTSLEIERLRLIITDLTNKYQSITGSKPLINIPSNKLNIFNQNINHNILHINDNDIKLNDNDMNMNDDDDDVLLNTGIVTSGGGGIGDKDNNGYDPSISLEEQLNNPSYNISSFPHKDISRIDIRTIKSGDGITYADPFAAVDLKYTGYKYLRDKLEWAKFTSPNISSTVFETRLGNHENIIGLEQAVLSMTKGEVAQVWVPSRLGYGIHGAEPLIPPQTDLIFELTLVEIRNDFGINGVDDMNGVDNQNGIDINNSQQGQPSQQQQSQLQQQHIQQQQQHDNDDIDLSSSPTNQQQQQIYNQQQHQYTNQQQQYNQNIDNNNDMKLYHSMVDDDDNSAGYRQNTFQVL